MPVQEIMPQQPRRPRELQDALNFYLYHPLAWKLAARLASTRITPNMVSIAGGLCVVAAAAAYAVPGWPMPAIVGMLLHMAWHVVDGADGDLARLTQRSSAIGELVDGICDYTSHIVLYVVLIVLLQIEAGPIAWVAGLAAGASHVVQSNHFEVQRRQYQWWVYGTPWLRNAPADEFVGNASFVAFTTGYLKLAASLSPQSRRVDAAVIDAAGAPPRLEAVRLLIRRRLLGLLPRMQPLSNNHRTVALGVSMLAGSPLYYFIYEVTVLNLVLLCSVRRFNVAAGQVSDEIDHLASTSR